MKNIIKNVVFALLIIGNATHAMETGTVATGLGSKLVGTLGNSQNWQTWSTAAWNNIAKPIGDYIFKWASEHPAVTATACSTLGIACITRTISNASSLNAQIQNTFSSAKTLAQQIANDKQTLARQTTGTSPAQTNMTPNQIRFVEELKKSYAIDLIDEQRPLQAIANKLKQNIYKLKRAQSIFLFPWQKEAINSNVDDLQLILSALLDTPVYKAEPKSNGWFGFLRRK